VIAGTAPSALVILFFIGRNSIDSNAKRHRRKLIKRQRETQSRNRDE
jgi:hypothetical protein